MRGRLLSMFAVLAVGAAALASGRTEAAFSDSPGTAGNSYTVAPDFVAPSVVRTAVADPTNPPSYAVRQCRFYYAFAEVADQGNPPSGVSAVTADLSALTSGLSAAPLAPGAYSLDGVGYGHRSLPQLATADPGGYGYDLTSTDNAGNTRQEGDFSASVGASPGPTVVFLTGLEQGVASSSAPGAFDTVTGAGVSADGAVHRHGSYSLRVAPAGAAAEAVAYTGGSSAVAVVRFALRLGSLPTATANLFSVIPSGGSSAFLAYNAPSGRLGVRWGTGAIVEGNLAPGVGTWYVVEMRANLGDPHSIEWRINGLAQPPANSAETARTVTGVGFGTAAAATYTAHFDDIIVSPTSSAYPLGNGKVLGLAPDGVGTHDGANRFREQDNGAIDGLSWTRVDEIPASSAGDYVKQVNRDPRRYLEFTFADTGEPCINAVGALLAYHSAGTAANDGTAVVLGDGTESVVFSGDMSETTLSYARAMVSSGAGAWTTALVNALVARVGYSSDVNPNPYWDALLLEYDVPIGW